MRYQEELVSKEGGYSRTGSRTPMQWDSTPNMGFSTADADKLYLPVDSFENAPTVENQKNDPDSVYKVVTDIIALRHAIPQLGNGSGFEVVYAEKEKYPFAYRRGDYVIFVNPSDKDETIDFTENVLETLYTIGNVTFSNGKANVGKSSFTIIRTK